jgi:hypothetical protein
MKLRTLSIFAAAAIVSLAACGGDEGDDTGGDTTAVTVDTGMALPPPAPMTPDTTMAPPVDTTMMDTTAADTTP